METEGTMETEGEGEGEAGGPSTETAWSQLPDPAQKLQPAAGAVGDFLNSQVPNNFLKDVKWSPDGLCLLSSNDDNAVRLFEMPTALLAADAAQREDISEWSEELDTMKSVLKVQEGETVYDIAWLPWMNSADPSTCCFFTTSRDNPVHCWDAFTGQMRGSYCAYTDAEELSMLRHHKRLPGVDFAALTVCWIAAAAYCMAFDNTSSKLYCGFNNCIRVYELERPGRQHKVIPTFRRANRETTGQRGIISCIDFNPDKSGLYATGSYSRNIGLFNSATGKLLYNLQGHRGGVTQVRWGADGNYLFSGGRKDDEILCWDVRNTGDILVSIPRKVLTNQRVQFDIDHSGRFLVTPSQGSSVILYDLCSEGVQPVFETSLPCQMVNGCALHPHQPYLAVSSGGRRFDLPANLMDEDEEVSMPAQSNKISFWDSSISVLRIG